ncbi:hAT family C-terminal dimerization region [Phytophthora infestans]|uniref:HAT family C-terminal dimerization region n=1 Tax=Phytophthora infestans TaxID=4787 RepID=A0A8S9UKR4_PHYIN|nr:hAT family C-terminal dimerization region [Phytophthora infestans]
MSAVPAPEIERTLAPAANEPPVIFSEDLMDFFEHNEAVPQTASRDVQEARVEEELERWISEPVAMNSDDKNGAEHILTFRSRQTSSSYQFLPTVARIIFAVPTSSAQIERDFGVSGMMVTSQRASISAMNIDMCSFLNWNREVIDVTQCPRL